MIHIFQIIAGASWLVPMALFTPSILRICMAPWHVRDEIDPLDVLVSPLAFVAALHVGFTIRWLLFPDAIEVMGSVELLIWTGLYALSTVAAVGSVLAWRVARRIV